MDKHIRDVRVKDIVRYSIVPPIIIVALWLISIFVIVKILPDNIAPLVYIVAAILSYYPLKAFAIGVILLYKIIAPIKVRECCRFHPTCSSYMILAIKKYGLFLGIAKGIGRIMRCKPPNGGEDYP